MGENLMSRAADLGKVLGEITESQLGSLDAVTGTQGIGMMRAVLYSNSIDFAGEDRRRGSFADRLFREAWKQGVVASTVEFDGTVLRSCTLLTPPLVISEAELRLGIDNLRSAIVIAVSELQETHA
jgi:4-aminobutyrate aminotransferase-like enzyme